MLYILLQTEMYIYIIVLLPTWLLWKVSVWHDLHCRQSSRMQLQTDVDRCSV